jgi:hypothetical protein
MPRKRYKPEEIVVCFGIQHGVQRLFHRATHHLAKPKSPPGTSRSENAWSTCRARRLNPPPTFC